MLRFVLVLIGCCAALLAVGQAGTQRLVVDALPDEGLPLTKWTFRAGDDPAWSRPLLPATDTAAWQPIDPSRSVTDLLPLLPDGIGWLRLTLQIAPPLRTSGVLFTWRQTAASELFVNGQPMRQVGTFPADGRPVLATHTTTRQTLLLQPDAAGQIVLAFRFAVAPNSPFGNYRPVNNWLLRARLLAANQPNEEPFAIRWQRVAAAFTAGLFFVLALLHGLFFVYNNDDRANGAMALACLSFALAFVSIPLLFGLVESYQGYADWSLVGTLAYPVGYVALTTAIYIIYQKRFGIVYWVVMALMVGCGGMLFVSAQMGSDWAEFGPALLATAECSRVTLLGRRQWGGQFITGGMICALILFSLFCIYSFEVLTPLRLLPASDLATYLIYYLAVLFIPLSISLYIARSFVFTQRRMVGQLLEVQRLSKQSFEQEKERQTMLARQKETLERQVAERTAQLQASLDELRTTQDQLVQKEKMASLGELTAGIAHEIQNPLNFVTNFSEVSVDLVNELQEERQRPAPDRDAGLEDELLGDLVQNLAKISHHGQRASGIVRNMLQHSRASTGQREATDLNALCDEYLRLSYHGLRAKDKSFNASFRADLDASLPPVTVVAQDVGRVLLNLVNNAFYAVQQRQQQGEAGYVPTVTVQTKVVGRQVEIRVRDNGTGIAAGVRDKIFQPFFTTKPTGSGTGLGLSLSYDIITKGHGGTLTLNSEAGQFTEFRITLPLSAA